MSFLSIRDYLEPLLGEKLPALPAELSTDGTRCKQDISQAGDTTLPGSTSRTYIRNAQDVIDMLRESNGYMDKLSKVSSEAELRRLCEEQSKAESTLIRITQSWYSIMPDLPSELLTEKLSTLTREELIEIAELRRQRRELLSLPYKAGDRYYDKLEAILTRLYLLTEYPPYRPKYYADYPS
jgi:hypothetical protein